MPGDRDPLPHFAGRIDELAELGERLDNVLLGNTTGGIQLITGVPGAGKSQLGRTFAEAARERGNARYEWVDVATVGRDVDLLLTIAEALDEDDAGRQVADLDTKLVGGGAGALGIRGQAAKTSHRPPCCPIPTGHVLPGFLARLEERPGLRKRHDFHRRGRGHPAPLRPTPLQPFVAEFVQHHRRPHDPTVVAVDASTLRGHLRKPTAPRTSTSTLMCYDPVMSAPQDHLHRRRPASVS